MSSQKVYILHGWAYSTVKWEKALEIMRSKDIEPIILNVPGLTEPSDQVYRIKDYVDWLHDLLKNKKNPIIVAHSNGGRIALNYDLAHPGHIKKLVLVSSAGVQDAPRRAEVKRRLVMVAAKVLSPLKHLPLVKRVAYKILGAQDYNQAPDNMKLTLRNMIASDKKLDVRKVKVQTDIIWGSDDSQTPMAQANILHNNLPNSQSLSIIDGARHAPYDTNPEEFVDLVLKAINND